jgi:hypothetical protein
MTATLPVVRGHYIPGKGKSRQQLGRQLSAHFKYLEYRKLGEHEAREDRYIFNAESDHIERKDAVDDILDHGNATVSNHHIVFSPAEYEHIDDYRQWIRDQMRDLEERKGIALHWYAVVQAHPRENTDTPHVHMVLAGVGEDLQTDKRRMVRMTAQDDYLYLRERGREHSNYEFYHEQDNALRELDDHDTTGREQPERTPEQSGRTQPQQEETFASWTMGEQYEHGR